MSIKAKCRCAAASYYCPGALYVGRSGAMPSVYRSRSDQFHQLLSPEPVQPTKGGLATSPGGQRHGAIGPDGDVRFHGSPPDVVGAKMQSVAPED